MEYETYLQSVESAKSGNPKGLANLGLFYYNGKFVDKNYKEAYCSSGRRIKS